MSREESSSQNSLYNDSMKYYDFAVKSSADSSYGGK